MGFYEKQETLTTFPQTCHRFNSNEHDFLLDQCSGHYTGYSRVNVFVLAYQHNSCMVKSRTTYRFSNS